MTIKNSVSGSKQVVSEIIDRNYGSVDQELLLIKVVQMEFLDSMFVLSSGGVIGVVGKYRENLAK